MSQTPTPPQIDPPTRRRKLRPGEQKTALYTFRSTQQQKNLVAELAARREVTFSDMTRVLLRLGLEAYEEGKR